MPQTLSDTFSEAKAGTPPRRWLWRARALCAFAGAWGMLSGFALFIVIEQRHRNWWLPLAAILLAAFAAAVVEALRHLAEGRVIRRPSLPRALGLFVMLIVFNLFVSACEGLVQEAEAWQRLMREIFGASTWRGLFNLVAFLTLWLLLAALLGARLMRVVEAAPAEKPGALLVRDLGGTATQWTERQRRIQLPGILWTGLKAGAFVGLVLVPLVVFAWSVVIPFLWAVGDYFWGTGIWTLSSYVTGHYLLALLILGALAMVVSERQRGFAIALLLLFFLRMYLGGGFADYATALDQLGRVAMLAAEVAMLWAPPAILLGLLVPFLRAPSQYPWLWSPLALFGALVSLVLVLLQGQPWLLLPAAVLIVAALLLRGGERVDGLWPLTAASVALLTLLATNAAVSVSPFTVYRNIHTVLVPHALGRREWHYLENQLRAVEAMSDPVQRIAGYAAVQERIKAYPPRRPGIPVSVDLFPPLHQSAMHGYLDERMALERALVAQAVSASMSRTQVFALATTASLSFWITLGMLGAWHMRRRRDAATDGGQGPAGLGPAG